MNSRLSLGCLLLIALTACKSSAHRSAASLTDRDRAALAQYEKVRAALAADDGRSAKNAAKEMADSLKDVPDSDRTKAFVGPAEAIADAPALDREREIFKTLSAIAISIGGGVSGYYIVSSPMGSGGDWLQTSTQIDNPYMGRVMHDTGEIKR